MTPLLLVGVAVSGGAGAAIRFIVDGAVRRLGGTRLPWGTLLINLSGSLLLGLLTGLALRGLVTRDAAALIGTGFLGGYTTFSTASIEAVRLAQERRWLAAVATGVMQLVAATGLALAGLALTA